MVFCIMHIGLLWMADEKLDTNMSSESEQNGTLEPSNGNEEAIEPSPTLENDDDEEKGDVSILE